MSSKGPSPVLLLSPQRTPLSPRSFQVKKHIDSPLRFKALTALPKDKKLSELSTIDRTLGGKVLNVLGNLYSHVVSRTHKEEVVTFFHHVASAALFEADCKTLINDRDHGKKAGGIFNQVKNVLTDLQQYLKESDQILSQDERQVLEQYIALFIMHHNILVTTLKNARSEVKQHLAQHANLHVERLEPLAFSTIDRALAESMYPQTPPRKQGVPLKDRLTPKSKSDEDNKSIAVFNRLNEDVGRPLGLAPSRNLLHSFLSQETKILPSTLPQEPVKPSLLRFK